LQSSCMNTDEYFSIVAVPGLGAHPEESWTWFPPRKRENARYGAFNWISDPNGLIKLYPNSRIMLYDFASAWHGSKRVRATLKSICTVLLDNLLEVRKGGTQMNRPLIFIGHSMGGLIIAKTICIAKASKEYEPLAICTVGCGFFGTPFHGTAMAKLGLLYTSVFGQEGYEALLSFMKNERNDTLDEVTSDFVAICNKFVPPIDLFCAYEEMEIDASKFVEKATQKAPALLSHQFFKDGATRLLNKGHSSLGYGQVSITSCISHNCLTP
ncbi:hypothetical protein K461DRAFT_232934, partial [Myriangium duriaei CBS 260.36]